LKAWEKNFPGGSAGDYPHMDKRNGESMFNSRGRALIFAMMMKTTLSDRSLLGEQNVSSISE
jgi:hypothetical protein